MAMSSGKIVAVVQHWMSLLYANYLRYARDSARAWMDRATLRERAIIREYVAEQDVLLAKMNSWVRERDALPPIFQYPEDVSYLNYVTLPLIFDRASQRMAATVPTVQDAVADIEAAGEYELADLGREFIALLQRQAEALRPFATEDRLNPA